VSNYVERKRETFNSQVKAMEIENVDEWVNDYENTYDHNDELNYMNYKGGFSKGCSKGYGKPAWSYEKGSKGSPVNFGKGVQKGYGKNASKGKTKGGYPGECFFCGEWGHSQSRCLHKDRQMQEYRSSQGILESSFFTKGKGKGTNSIEEYQPIDSTTKELESLEQRAGWRQLCNVEVFNQFDLLTDTGETHGDIAGPSTFTIGEVINNYILNKTATNVQKQKQNSKYTPR
jgi:hypothetical protein